MPINAIDLASIYHQIKVQRDFAPKKKITTLFRLFEYIYMSFRFKKAAVIFQYIMNKIFPVEACVFRLVVSEC